MRSDSRKDGHNLTAPSGLLKLIRFNKLSNIHASCTKSVRSCHHEGSALHAPRAAFPSRAIFNRRGASTTGWLRSFTHSSAIEKKFVQACGSCSQFKSGHRLLSHGGASPSDVHQPGNSHFSEIFMRICGSRLQAQHALTHSICSSCDTDGLDHGLGKDHSPLRKIQTSHHALCEGRERGNI